MSLVWPIRILLLKRMKICNYYLDSTNIHRNNGVVGNKTNKCFFISLREGLSRLTDFRRNISTEYLIGLVGVKDHEMFDDFKHRNALLQNVCNNFNIDIKIHYVIRKGNRNIINSSCDYFQYLCDRKNFANNPVPIVQIHLISTSMHFEYIYYDRVAIPQNIAHN